MNKIKFATHSQLRNSRTSSKKNPFKFDNQGFLKNAPSEQIQQKIIEARVAHLEQEIQTFYNHILKIITH